ncbi:MULTISPECIES: hypothetical protein [Latilactobacillus]|uniref:Integral membrane protein n=1 Tax=Latilactobacillus curvatus TaxID=28038 RepID=A0ABM7QYK1_LATCU|nr:MULTISPECIES: hypothetical protein [Latilactobacillus]ASN13582.1 hypothetical protein B4V05_10140 [Latilactobacillus sakei]KGB13920.1 hypothetical protein KY41_10375 [Latilactobacillus sakei]UTB73296.1 hypothetical protein A4W72_11095 [Latilactobacillus curvatus]BCX31528.1 hypothetical protein LTWDN19_20950 [Latilactobacillus curvatus]
MKNIKTILTLLVFSIIISSILLIYAPTRILHALLLISIWGTAIIYFGLESFHIYNEWSQYPRGNIYLISNHLLLGIIIAFIQSFITVLSELLLLSKIMRKPIDISKITGVFKFQLGDILEPSKVLNDFQSIYTQTHGKILYVIGITSILTLVPLFSAVLVPILYLLHKKPKKFLYFGLLTTDIILIIFVILIFN